MSFKAVVEFLSDFLAFLRERKRLWLLPLVVILLLMALLVSLTHDSAVAPLIYTRP